MDSTEKRRLIAGNIALLMKNGRLALEKGFFQHGDCTVYRHSVCVAIVALAIADRLNLRVEYQSLVRGALLHDYFLYDWHTRVAVPCTHGFTHPFTALKNARADFLLNELEADIIAHHMFPLVPIPPLTKEGWIVCLADKICAAHETCAPRLCAVWSFLGGLAGKVSF